MALRYLTCVLLSAVLLSTSLLAEGVRVANHTRVPPNKVVISKPRRPRMEKARDGNVPSMYWFLKEWNEFADAENYTLPEGRLPRIVVGLFTKLNPYEAVYWQVIRDTWMRSPLVCTVADREAKGGEKATANCPVFATFVVGNNTGAFEFENVTYSPSRVDKDFTVLPIKENMNGGKTRSWFEYAAKKYTWATHIAKMDMDAYVFTHKVVTMVRDNSLDCPNVFGGVTHTCWRGDACPPPECWHKQYPNRPANYNFLQVNPGANSTCWHYMQGAFYFMSRDLAARATAHNPDWESRDKVGMPEDATTGFALSSYARKNEACITGINLGWQDKKKLLHHNR